MATDLRASLTELVAAMRRYEGDVEGDTPIFHRDMMSRAEAALADPLQQLADQAQALDMGYGPNACPTCGRAAANPTIQGMADCMDMVRRDLIDMGIIDQSTAPMFIPEAVASYVKRSAIVVVPEIHQWRRKLTNDPWHDASKEEAYARVDDLYEARTVYAAPALVVAASPAQPEDDEFTVDDPDLNELLNLAADMVKGHANMDTATLWLEYLERVQARLAPATP